MVANVGKSAAMERIRDELGISSVFMRTSTARERAYHKCYVSGPEAGSSGHWENAYEHIPDRPAPVEHENRRPKV
ncbi:hypothetical protein AYI70_g830 [Smittium culicis]|uniref:Uncharacterized protein n=1 Tax=Smittium culicis TaxID=133412 RepID=A0A1R1YFG5_9FUNG|nr:hypothetical protein AYI70_g830 [Smittium culicis]